MSNFFGINTSGALGGFSGAVNPNQLEEIYKSLSGGYALSGQTGGNALQVQSLEASLKTLSYSNNHLKFWQKVPKTPAYNLVEEYDQVVEYGPNSNVLSTFLTGSETPPERDMSIARQTAKVKFMGLLAQVDHVLTTVHPAHGDVVSLRTKSAILDLLRDVEKSMFTANSAISDYQWDGLDKQIDATSVLDLEGTAMDITDVNDAANILTEAYAIPTDMFSSNQVNTDLMTALHPQGRYNFIPAITNGTAGLSIERIQTPAGPVELNPDLFIKKSPSPPSAATHTQAPLAPASVTYSALSGTDANFSKGAPAGTNEYAYAVTACNRFGESAPTFVASNQAITAGNKTSGVHVNLTITNPGSVGTYPPEYFRVYRTNPMSSGAAVPSAVTSYSLISQVKASSTAGSGTTATTDINYYLPFTSVAYMGQMTPDVITFRQLLPMIKWDLAITGPAFRFMVLLYGTPVLFTPKKWVRIINIGQLA